MTEIWINVYPDRDGWRVVRIINKDHYPDGVVDTEIVATYRWKFQARRVALFLAHYEARRLAQDEAVELTIHKRNGQIGEKNTYGYDPEKTVG